MRKLHEIAREIRKDWKPQPYFGAVPYIEAMSSLGDISDHHGADNAKGIVLYFMSNASTWRGAVARRVKAELKLMVK